MILAVKAWQVPDAAVAMRPLIGPESFVVPLENGVEAPDQLAAVLGQQHVMGGLCRILAFIAGPGEIHHTAIAPHIAFGELDGKQSARAESLRQAFGRTVGITAEIPADIRSAMWSKFLFIAPVSGVGAITRVPIGVFRHIPETRRLLIEAFEEIVALAKALGVSLPNDAVAADSSVYRRRPARRDVLDAARYDGGTAVGAGGAGGSGRAAGGARGRRRAGASLHAGGAVTAGAEGAGGP